MLPHPPTAALNTKNSQISASLAASQNPRGNSKKSLLVLGMKQRQEEMMTLLQSNTNIKSVTGSQNNNNTAINYQQPKTLSFGWTEQLSSVYGSSCEAVFEVLSSIDASVRNSFSSATEHYASVCSALEIRHSAARPANRQIYECCVAHDQLEELILTWATEQAGDNNIEKFTRVSEGHSANETASMMPVAVASSKFDRLSWECESAANKSLSHQDTNTLHHADSVDRYANRHLNEKVRESRRALLELALNSAAEHEDGQKNSSSSSTLISLEKEILSVWNSAALSTLSLAQSALGERGFVSLLATLQALPHLSSLSITDAHLISPFIVALAVVCRPKYLPRLRQLDLNGNPGGSMAVEALCELVRAHPLLNEVHIDRGFECLPSSRKRLTNALNHNKTKNEIRMKKCEDELEREERELNDASAKKEQDRIATLFQSLLVIEDIESRAREMLKQIEQAEYESEYQTGFDREKLSLEMFLQQQEEKEQQRLAHEKKDQVWRETLASERSSVETKETGVRRGIEADADKTFSDLCRSEEAKRENIIGNATARKQLGFDLEKDQQKRDELAKKLEAARSEYKNAFDERLDVDRQLALVRRQYLEKSLVDTVNTDEPSARHALTKTEDSTRDFLISRFNREKLDRQRRHEERLEIERVAAEQLTRRRMAQEQEDSIRRKEEEQAEENRLRREDEERLENIRKNQRQFEQQESEKQESKKLVHDNKDEQEHEHHVEQHHQAPPIALEAEFEEGLQRSEIDDEEAQARGGLRRLNKLSVPSVNSEWKVDEPGSKTSSSPASDADEENEEKETETAAHVERTLPPAAENHTIHNNNNDLPEKEKQETQDHHHSTESAKEEHAARQKLEEEAARAQQWQQQKQLVSDEEDVDRAEISSSEGQERGGIRLLMKMASPTSKTNEDWEKQKQMAAERNDSDEESDRENNDVENPPPEPQNQKTHQEEPQGEVKVAEVVHVPPPVDPVSAAEKHQDEKAHNPLDSNKATETSAPKNHEDVVSKPTAAETREDDKSSELSTPQQQNLQQKELADAEENELPTPKQETENPAPVQVDDAKPEMPQKDSKSAVDAKDDEASELSTPEKSPAPAKTETTTTPTTMIKTEEPHQKSAVSPETKEKSKSKSKSSSSGASRKSKSKEGKAKKEDFDDSSSIDSDAIRQASTDSSASSSDSEL